MASIKSILAAVDRVETIDITTDTCYGPVTSVSIFLRPSGHITRHSLKLALSGRLGKIVVLVEIEVFHTYQHNDDGDLVGLSSSKPEVKVTDLPEGITSVEVFRTLEQIGCNIQNF